MTDIKNTAVHKKLMRVRAIIDVNKKFFKPGTNLPTAYMLKVIEVKAPVYTGLTADEIVAVTKTYVRRVSSWQTLFNYVLAPSGLYLSQSKGQFYIRTVEGTRKRVASFKREAVSRSRMATILEEGMHTNKCKYTKISNRTVGHIAKGIIARSKSK